MEITDIDMSKAAFVYGAIHSLANRMQVIGDRIDPTISTKQWFVLAAVSKFNKAPPNIGDVAKLLGTSRQNIKKIANILEQRGYLRLQKDQNDLRNIQLCLTENCYDYFKSRDQRENEYLENIFSGIDDEMLSTLCNGMKQLIENIDRMMNGDSNLERQG